MSDLGVEGIRVVFGDRIALDDVTLDAPAGQVTAVVGGDGAGKTTLLRVLAGRARVQSGRVRTLAKAEIGYQPATSGVWGGLTVAENIAFVGRAFGMPEAAIRARGGELLDRAGLADARTRLGRDLSGGMRQKLGFLLAILHDPRLVLLDEPSTGVDPVSRVELWRLIADAADGRTAVLLATTYLDEAARAAAVTALDGGAVIASGTPEGIVAGIPGSVVESDPSATVPIHLSGRRAWRRGAARHRWLAPGESAGPGDARIDVDLEDAVTVLALAREAAAGAETGAETDVAGAHDRGRAEVAADASACETAAGRATGDAAAGGRAIGEDGAGGAAAGGVVAGGAAAGGAVAGGAASAGPPTGDAVAGRAARWEPPTGGAVAGGVTRWEPPTEGAVTGGAATGPGGQARRARSRRIADPAPRASDLLVEGRGLTRRFGARAAVEDVSIRVSRGEIVGLIGANGAGKTTLLRMLLGLERADAGDIVLFGDAPAAGRARVGYVPQSLGLAPALSAEQNAAFFARVYRMPRPPLPAAIRAVAHEPVASLGGGLQRQLAFALALAHAPDLLVLDEPTSGVDPLSRARLWERIHARADAGVGVLVTTHYLQEAAQCTRLALLSRGRLVGVGSVAELTAGIRAVAVRSTPWRRAFEVLTAAGLPTMLDGRSVRIAGADPARVRAALAGIDADVREVAPTLEEAMVLRERAASSPPP